MEDGGAAGRMRWGRAATGRGPTSRAIARACSGGSVPCGARPPRLWSRGRRARRGGRTSSRASHPRAAAMGQIAPHRSKQGLLHAPTAHPQPLQSTRQVQRPLAIPTSQLHVNAARRCRFRSWPARSGVGHASLAGRRARPGVCSNRGGGGQTGSDSPESPGFSSAYCRTVSSSRYRVAQREFSAITSDLSTSSVSSSSTWWGCT